jgi:hypothetical protein
MRTIRLSLHCIKSPNQPNLITSLKSHNLTDVHNRAKSSNPFDNPILQQTTDSARGCTEIVTTVAMGIRNVCLSRCWDAEQVIFRSCTQTSESFTHLVAQKPDQAPI